MTLPADVLDDAADLIEERGWRQGSHRGVMRQRVCMVEAVSMAANGQGNVIGDVLDALTTKLFPAPVYADSLIRWNDSKGREAQEVLDLLRDTAKELRNG